MYAYPYKNKVIEFLDLIFNAEEDGRIRLDPLGLLDSDPLPGYSLQPAT